MPNNPLGFTYTVRHPAQVPCIVLFAISAGIGRWSGSVPCILGVILICRLSLADRVTTQLFQAYEQMVKSLIVLGLGELLIIPWLLIKRATVDPPDA